MHTVTVGSYAIAQNQPFTLIAGPCAIESQQHALFMANALQEACDELGINLIYKSSFDKANRSSVESARGAGLEQGLEILETVRAKTGLPILTDIHTEAQATRAGEVVDVLQIPAFLCRQTDLLLAAGATGKAINVKKGQFLAPWDMGNIVAKLESTGNRQILLCERGASFGYNTLVSDMRSLPIMAQTGYPVVFDATHSVQQPGGMGKTSGGQRQFVPTLARAALAVGVAAVFMEVHENPDSAPSDGPNMVPLNRLKALLKQFKAIDTLVKSPDFGPLDALNPKP